MNCRAQSCRSLNHGHTQPEHQADVQNSAHSRTRTGRGMHAVPFTGFHRNIHEAKAHSGMGPTWGIRNTREVEAGGLDSRSAHPLEWLGLPPRHTLRIMFDPVGRLDCLDAPAKLTIARKNPFAFPLAGIWSECYHALATTNGLSAQTGQQGMAPWRLKTQPTVGPLP